jgi:hypothetical protein
MFWIFKTKPNLSESYWNMYPSIISSSSSREVKYEGLSLGWIYEGLFDQARFGVRGQTLGKGWKRLNLGIL